MSRQNGTVLRAAGKLFESSFASASSSRKATEEMMGSQARAGHDSAQQLYAQTALGILNSTSQHVSRLSEAVSLFHPDSPISALTMKRVTPAQSGQQRQILADTTGQARSDDHPRRVIPTPQHFLMLTQTADPAFVLVQVPPSVASHALLMRNGDNRLSSRRQLHDI